MRRLFLLFVAVSAIGCGADAPTDIPRQELPVDTGPGAEFIGAYSGVVQFLWFDQGYLNESVSLWNLIQPIRVIITRYDENRMSVKYSFNVDNFVGRIENETVLWYADEDLLWDSYSSIRSATRIAGARDGNVIRCHRYLLWQVGPSEGSNKSLQEAMAFVLYPYKVGVPPPWQGTYEGLASAFHYKSDSFTGRGVPSYAPEPRAPISLSLATDHPDSISISMNVDGVEPIEATVSIQLFNAASQDTLKVRRFASGATRDTTYAYGFVRTPSGLHGVATRHLQALDPETGRATRHWVPTWVVAFSSQKQ